MCYFEQTRWSCGYWRWGSFRQQCTKEYRTGETCGLKLVFATNQEMDNCRLCKDMEKKQRKYTKLNSDISRWQREGHRAASIAKAEEDKRDVQEKLHRMLQEHEARQYGSI
ncbi:hypothetical protein F5Y15DRAFT_101540 [Xylariaceae sp. FL0016]|nr:hypothetical protein F5Y15DRAFT_101540 [Xylariaceae sp. FL0016]